MRPLNETNKHQPDWITFLLALTIIAIVIWIGAMILGHLPTDPYFTY